MPPTAVIPPAVSSNATLFSTVTVAEERLVLLSSKSPNINPNPSVKAAPVMEMGGPPWVPKSMVPEIIDPDVTPPIIPPVKSNPDTEFEFDKSAETVLAPVTLPITPPTSDPEGALTDPEFDNEPAMEEPVTKP